MAVDAVELRDIEYFAVVAEHGNLARAAEALGLSTAALSKSLRRLQSAVGARLVRRTPRGVEPTSEGRTLLARIGALRSSVADVEREIRDVSNGRVGHVRVGVHPGMQRDVLARACSALAREAPKATVAITIDTNEALEAALAKGELDLILHGMTAPVEGMGQEALYDDEFVVYCSSRHRLARRKRLTLADLSEQRWVMWTHTAPSWQLLAQALAAARLPPPQVAVTTNSVSLRLEIVGSSDLLGINLAQVVRDAAPRYGLVELRIPAIALAITTGITSRKGAYLSPAARRFREILRDVVRRRGERPLRIA